MVPIENAIQDLKVTLFYIPVIWLNW
jgi:hypothetical protein